MKEVYVYSKSIQPKKTKKAVAKKRKGRLRYQKWLQSIRENLISIKGK